MAVLKDVTTMLANTKAAQVQAWKDAQGMELADYGALTVAVNNLQRGKLDSELSNLEATEGAEPPTEFKEQLLAAVKNTEKALNSVETVGNNSFKSSDIVYCKSKTTDGSMVDSFNGCSCLYLVEGLDASAILDLTRAFKSCRRLRSVEFTNDSLSKTTNFLEAFYQCSRLRYITFPAPWHALKSAIRAFAGCSKLERVDILDGSLVNLTDGRYMFNDCNSLKELKFPAGALANLVSADIMFSGCSSLTSLTLPEGSLANVTTAGSMFSGCSSLTSLTLPEGSLANVTTANNMFSGCSSLTSLTLPEGSFSKVTTVSNMLNNCKGIETFAFPEGSLVDTRDFTGVFQSCTSLKSATFPVGSCSKGVSMSLIISGCTSLTTFSFPENGMASCLYAYNMIGGTNITSLGNLDLSAIALTKSQLTTAGVATSANVTTYLAQAAKIVYGGQAALTDCILHGTLYKSGARVDLLPNLDGPSVLSWVNALYDWTTNAENKETDDTTHTLYISSAQQELLLEQEGGDVALINAMEYGWTLEG